MIPEITLRIPGSWESSSQLSDALTRANTGYIIQADEIGADMYLLHQPSGQRFRVAADAAEDELFNVFADAPRPISPRELSALKKHKVKVFVSGPGGSLESARSFLAIGAAFIKAGALGIMVDNSGNVHSPSDWMKLASDKQMGGMYWAFVAVSTGKDEVFSAGMHCLGFRDAELPDPVDRRAAGMMMHEFLGYTYQSGVTIVDGDPIGGPDGPEFILRHVDCTRFPRQSPWHNPYGLWRFEKFVDDAEPRTQ